jgi:hypothetical protein
MYIALMHYLPLTQGKEVPDAVAVARAALPSLMNDYDMECSGFAHSFH